MKNAFVSLAIPGLLASSLLANSAYAANCQNPLGTWLNELGSTMTISTYSSSSGAISGAYKSPSGTSGQTFPLSGWFYAPSSASPGLDQVTLFTFSVNWNTPQAQYNSITTWSGTCRTTNGSPTIQALWYYTNAFGQYSWKHTNAGQDVFQPTGPQ
ncbi:avidin family protein [Burkholderia thailandensis 34]|uniref:avidin/streptavidin family protein n=1 Tax=Burkholderia thailandensis TaxID=57975 RepID=UPI0005DA462B|nr:avidin/streptavidin family protein [Burkholderia thailandensis]AJY30941.1 avidin family protein [Burkholderia thailandensis 34]AOJ59300.1 avidin [Burkholderia thailandensis]KXF58422.1 avidin [Burkholderia thailandensis]PNE78990.1 avidin [Burkholderia thailandensis]